MIYLILILTGIFAIWGIIYSHNIKQNENLIKNISKYEEKKAKQHKSKIS